MSCPAFGYQIHAKRIEQILYVTVLIIRSATKLLLDLQVLPNFTSILQNVPEEHSLFDEIVIQ